MNDANVFVLSPGRSGSLTFAEACRHMDNFTVAHESQAGEWGYRRFAYPPGHIEVDNRLSWFLGELGERYPRAVFVRLCRDPELVARSFLARWGKGGVIDAFASGIIMGGTLRHDAQARLEICRYYVATVNANLDAFLGYRRVLTVNLGEPDTFREFWRLVGARGDLAKACEVFATKHNETTP